MKLICNRGALLEALMICGNVVAARTPKPVLQCVKMEAKDNQLTLSATDMELSIRYRDNQVDISEPGDMLVQADKLRDIVRESMDDSLSIETSGEMAVVKGQDSVFKMYRQPVDSFPPIADAESDSQFEVNGGLLKKLITQTLFAAAKTSTQYAFNGVLVVAKGKQLSLVSTDGHRLALANGELAKPAKNEKEIHRAIVPLKAMGMIDKLIDNPEEPVGFVFRENQVSVQTPSATLTSNLVEGKFPPYEDVLPKDGNKHMTASTADLLSAVKRASLINTEESRGVRMSFSKNGLVISCQSPVAGESTINFPCKYDGEPLDIGFNPDYMVEALKVVDVDEVNLEMTLATKPSLLRAGPNFQYVIMPLSLQ